MIHQSHVRILLFVVSRWETAKLCPKTDLRNLWIVSYFVLFSVLCARCPLFLTNFVPFRRVPTTCFAPQSWDAPRIPCPFPPHSKATRNAGGVSRLCVLHSVFMFINRQLFISRDIQWHVTVFSVFFVKVKVEFVSLSANFDYLYLN